jgi:hypothetical protein
MDFALGKTKYKKNKQFLQFFKQLENMEDKKGTRVPLTKEEQDKIVKTINTGAIPKNIGFPKIMSGVTWNIEKQCYE